MIKKIIDNVKEKFFLYLSIIFAILTLTYQTPESQMSIMLQYFGYSPQTSYDYPSVFVWFFVITFVVILSDSFFINQKAFHSDLLWANGLDTNCSCTGQDIKVVGDWCYVRTEGIKEFPIPGNHVVCALATHTHRIGTQIVIESHVIPKTDLTFIPYNIKPDVRQRRFGLLGANTCSVGYLSSLELLQNKQFKANDFNDVIEDTERNKIFDTSAFIESIRDKNRDLNMMVEFSNGENESLTKYLKNVGQVGKAILLEKNASVIDKLFMRS